MSTQIDPVHNLDALLIGTVEFFFSQSADSVADARLKGYRFFGNVNEATPQVDLKKETHMGSYRGIRRVDKTIGVDQKLGYKVKCDEYSFENLLMMMAGEEGTAFTQSAIATATPGTAILFTALAPGVKGNHYEVLNAGGTRVRKLTSLSLAVGPIKSTAATNAGDLFTLAGHALVNGDRVLIVAIGTSAGVTAGSSYYVVAVSGDTFQLSLTSGGAAVVLTADGTVTMYKHLTETTDYTVDMLLGMFRLITAQTATVTPIIICPAITSSDVDYFRSILPLEVVTRTGFGKLVFYDQDDDNRVVMEHTDFDCEVTVDAASAINGTGFSDMTFEVSIRANTGTLLVRAANVAADVAA